MAGELGLLVKDADMWPLFGVGRCATGAHLFAVDRESAFHDAPEHR